MRGQCDGVCDNICIFEDKACSFFQHECTWKFNTTRQVILGMPKTCTL